jgi:hypothetical protein
MVGDQKLLAGGFGGTCSRYVSRYWPEESKANPGYAASKAGSCGSVLRTSRRIALQRTAAK